jgi:glycosyltransferase involved in cell wall biosynthesis
MGLGREVWVRLPAWERFLVRRCSRLLAISSFTAEYFARRAGVRPEDISILRLPVGPLFQSALLSAETAPDADSPLRLLTVSRIVRECRYKGLFSLAESLPEILVRRPDVRWIVVGGGDDLPRLRVRCGELGVSAQVDFREDVDDAGLLDAYREADLFVLPSVAEPDAVPPTGEGFGIVYAEAACFGLPSIASAEGGGALDFIEDGVSGVTVPVDAPQALAEAVERLGAAPEERHRLGEAARARVASHHLPEHFARVLRSALGT